MHFVATLLTSTRALCDFVDQCDAGSFCCDVVNASYGDFSYYDIVVGSISLLAGLYALFKALQDVVAPASAPDDASLLRATHRRLSQALSNRRLTPMHRRYLVLIGVV